MVTIPMIIGDPTAMTRLSLARQAQQMIITAH